MVTKVAAAADRRGWGARMVATSPLPGPSGNVEYFVWLRRGDATIGAAEVEAEVRRTAGLGAPGERVVP
jgi:23S rRNA (cytidine1920-2'-O)/16S rRNA (cytidine1409-2'-O)-methyltransferase